MAADGFARVASFVSAVIALLALTIAGLTYSRAGRRPDISVVVSDAPDGDRQVRVTVKNRGLAPVTVDHVGLSVPDRDLVLPTPGDARRLRNGEGRDEVLRFRLEGGDSRLFVWGVGEIDRAAVREEGGHRQVRAEARIFGEVQRTDWVTIS